MAGPDSACGGASGKTKIPPTRFIRQHEHEPRQQSTTTTTPRAGSSQTRPLLHLILLDLEHLWRHSFACVLARSAQIRQSLVSTPLSDWAVRVFPSILDGHSHHIFHHHSSHFRQDQISSEQRRNEELVSHRVAYPQHSFLGRKEFGNKHTLNTIGISKAVCTSATQLPIKQSFPHSSHQTVGSPRQIPWPPRCQTTSPLSRAGESSLAISWNWKSTRLSK